MSIKISQDSFSSPTGGFENLVGETVVEVKEGPEMKGENVVTTTIVTQSGRTFVVFPWPDYNWDGAYCMPQEEGK